MLIHTNILKIVRAFMHFELFLIKSLISDEVITRAHAARSNQDPPDGMLGTSPSTGRSCSHVARTAPLRPTA